MACVRGVIKHVVIYRSLTEVREREKEREREKKRERERERERERIC